MTFVPKRGEKRREGKESTCWADSPKGKGEENTFSLVNSSSMSWLRVGALKRSGSHSHT